MISLASPFSLRASVSFVLSFTLTIYYPVYVWDALALYDFRAKIIAQTGFFVQVAGNFTYFAQYPLLTSLTHTIIYLFGGNNPQFTYSIYYVSFAVIFFSLINKESGRLIALIASLFLVTSPEIFQHSIIAYTNLPYTILYVVGVLYLYKAVTKNKYNYITTRLEDMLVNFNPSSEVYDFLGFNSSNELADSVLKRKRELFADKKITYKKSDGSEVILTIADIENRLFDLSFDPNHPPELRWGAPKNSGERQNMKLFSTPLRTGESLEALNAYELEKGLRYYPMRQNTSTSLNPEVNPKEPPFKLFDEVIGKYV